MKMKIWIEEAMKEMVEEVEKNEPMPKHWKRNVLLFCLLSAVCFQTGLLVLAKNGIASADRSPLFIAIGIVCSMLVGVVLIKCCLYAKTLVSTKKSWSFFEIVEIQFVVMVFGAQRFEITFAV